MSARDESPLALQPFTEFSTFLFMDYARKRKRRSAEQLDKIDITTRGMQNSREA
jgi:hypothetical protein